MSPRAEHLAGIAADADTMTEVEVYYDTPEWVALMEWLEFHGVNPKRIPAGTRVSRDACGRCIRYVGIVVDDQGEPTFEPNPDADPDDVGLRSLRFVRTPMVEQGEAAPLPFPDVIREQLR